MVQVSVLVAQLLGRVLVSALARWLDRPATPGASFTHRQTPPTALARPLPERKPPQRASAPAQPKPGPALQPPVRRIERPVPAKPSKKREPSRRTRPKGYLGPQPASPTRKGYTPMSDEVALDRFLFRLKRHCADHSLAYARIDVSGLTGPPRKSTASTRMNPRRPHYGDTKLYVVRLIGLTGAWNLDERLAGLDWSDADAAKARVRAAADHAEGLLEDVLADQPVRAGISAGVGREGVRVALAVELPITLDDLVAHLGTGSLSPFGVGRIEDVKQHLSRRLPAGALTDYFKNRTEWEVALRRAEKAIRRKEGLRDVGDEWATQALLFTLVRELEPGAKREYSPSWLHPQRFDVYVPQLKLAIEYQGAQHYEPIEFFGGEEALRKRQELDRRKRTLSARHRVNLFEWRYDVPVHRDAVRALLDEVASLVSRQT